jgi:hypothetical protein
MRPFHEASLGVASAAMSNRRSRSRDRKARASDATPQDVAVVATRPAGLDDLARTMDPSQTAQLRALEAGWDELLS